MAILFLKKIFIYLFTKVQKTCILEWNIWTAIYYNAIFKDVSIHFYEKLFRNLFEKQMTFLWNNTFLLPVKTYIQFLNKHFHLSIMLRGGMCLFMSQLNFLLQTRFTE